MFGSNTREKPHLLLDITCETNAAKGEHAGMKFWRHKREQDIEMILLHCIYSWLGYLENYLIDFFLVFKYRTVTSDSASYILQQCIKYNGWQTYKPVLYNKTDSRWSVCLGLHTGQGVKQWGVTVNLEKKVWLYE